MRPNVYVHIVLKVLRCCSNKLAKRLRDARTTTEKLVKKFNSRISSSQVTSTQPAAVPMQA